MFTVLNEIRGRRVWDVIWMERTVAWLPSLTQLGGKKSLQFIKSEMSCIVHVSGYFGISCFAAVLRDLLWSFSCALALIHIRSFS